MANTLLTHDMITKEAIMILHEKATFLRSVNRQYDPQFAQSGAQIGSALRIRKPAQYVAVDGATMTPQDSVEQYTTLNVTSRKHVGIQFTSAEKTLHLNDFRRLILEPAMSTLVAAMEYDCISRATRATFNQVGTAGTIPATLTPYLDGRAKLNQNLAPKANRNALVSSVQSAKIVDALKSLAQDESGIAKQYREGSMGRVVGFDWAESESMRTHTNGTQTMAGTVSVTVSADGAESLVVAGAGNAGTIKAGTVFTIAGVFDVHPETKAPRAHLKQFVVTADATANGSGVATLSVSPPMFFSATGRQNISSAPAATAVTTYVGAASTGYEQALLYQENAFTLATADLVLPQGAEGSRAVHDGVSLRIVTDYNITDDLHPTRIDVLYGFAALRPEHACRVTS